MVVCCCDSASKPADLRSTPPARLSIARRATISLNALLLKAAKNWATSSPRNDGDDDLSKTVSRCEPATRVAFFPQPIPSRKRKQQRSRRDRRGCDYLHRPFKG